MAKKRPKIVKLKTYESKLSNERTSTVQLNGVVFDIHIADEILIGEDETQAFGACRNMTQDIVICNKQPMDGRVRTLLHEIIHAIDMNYSTKLTEKQVNVLSQALHDVFTLNSWYHPNIYEVIREEGEEYES